MDSMRPNRILLILSETQGKRPLPPWDESVVRRVLCGEQQKALAFELKLAVSTLSTRHNRALRMLCIARGEVPVSLVLAAQCASGLLPRISARGASFEHQGARCRVISVPRPAASPLVGLSPVERQVAAWLIEGCSRRDIAAKRGTSKHTVSRHVHSIFRGLEVSGRYALIRRAAELGCWAAE
jgi:DNA-binding NarL/FixJ family response regulator